MNGRCDNRLTPPQLKNVKVGLSTQSCTSCGYKKYISN